MIGEIPADLVVTITDVRAAGFCARGIKRWFDDHGLDFADMLANGIPADQLLATGDGQAEMAVKRALERRNG